MAKILRFPVILLIAVLLLNACTIEIPSSISFEDKVYSTRSENGRTQGIG